MNITSDGRNTYSDRDQMSSAITAGDSQASVDTGALLGGSTQTYTLDAVANRTAHSTVTGDWVYDVNNRLVQRGFGPCGTVASCYSWDDAGNLTQKTEPGNRVTQFVYDSQNRLTAIHSGTATPSSANLVARYGYDPMHRRIWKEHYRDPAGQPLAQAKRTLYLYADEGLIAESTQSITLNADASVTANTAPAISTQYGPRPDSPFGTGALFIKTQNSNGQATLAYYHHDHLNTPIQATDKAGNVVWAASYDPFGQASIITPAATPAIPTITSNLRLPGQYWDAETGLHYNWHRYYEPQTGRYTQRDPIGLEGGINAYAYVNGNPSDDVDPYGLFDWADMPTIPQGLVDFSAGFGDAISFGATSKIRDWGGINGSVNKCSSWYSRGEIGADAVSTFGGGGLIAKAFIRRPGTMWSHWIPDRFVRPLTLKARKPNPEYMPWLDEYFGWFVNGAFNGNYVSPKEHYQTDNKYFPSGWRGMGFRFNKVRQMINRIPQWLPGSMFIGAAAKDAIGCECKGK